jgi:AAA family ATP:ADP antiporter
MKNFANFISELDPKFKKNAFYIFLTYFFILFSYPMVRSSIGAIFYEHYTSQNYSLATFNSILALIFIIHLSNKAQEKIGVRLLFSLICVFTTLIMLSAYFLLDFGINWMAYVLFATKEIYIVLLIHLTLAYANSKFSLEQIQRLYGPLGAAGSIGGIIGGQITSQVAQLNNGTSVVFFLSIFAIMLCLVPFVLTEKSDHSEIKSDKNITPLKTVGSIKKYVFLIAAIVAVTQWVIFIADLQFNMVFESVVTDKNARTSYLGNIYTLINVVTLFIQFIVLPIIMVRLSIKSIFFFIPIFYMLLVFGGLGFGAGILYIVAGVFISMKAVDYSVSSIVKEVMYHPLSRLQKYGAKYITDMFVYRSSKALIAFVFAMLSLKEMGSLNFIQAVLILLWIWIVKLLFDEQKNISK